MKLGGVRIDGRNVGTRADRDEHALTIERESNVACEVPARAGFGRLPRDASRGKVGYDHLRRAGRLHITIVIRKADDGVCVTNVQISRIRPGWIKRQPERKRQAAGELFGLLGLSIGGYAAKNQHLPRIRLHDEQIAIRRSLNQAGIVEFFGKAFHLEAGRRLGPRIGGLRDRRSEDRGGLGGVWRRQICHGDVVNVARSFAVEISERAYVRRPVPGSSIAASGILLARDENENQ